MPRIATDEGNELHYVEAGPADGEPIVLVHGWPEFWFGWRRQLPFLANLGYRCLAIDLRGFGNSSKPKETEQYSMKRQCSDFVKLLDHLEIPSATFLGHDWGGAVVWRMALWFPDRCKAVAAVCTPYRPRTSIFVPIEAVAEKMPQFWYQVYFGHEGGLTAAKEFDAQPERFFRCLLRGANERAGTFMRKGDNSFLENYPADVSSSKLLSEEDFNKYVEQYRENGFLPTLQWYQTHRLNWEEEVSMPVKVKQPAMMISAEKDVVLKPEMTIGMEEWVPNLSRATVADAGHWVLQEQPERVNEILRDWLTKTVPTKANL